MTTDIAPHDVTPFGTTERVAGNLMQGLRCAALLNANARKVNGRVRDQIKALLPGEVFMTRTQEEADEIVNKMIDEGYDIIFAGGGDGTIAHLINSLASQLETRGIDPHGRLWSGWQPFSYWRHRVYPRRSDFTAHKWSYRREFGERFLRQS